MKSDDHTNQDMQVGQLTGERAAEIDHLSESRRVYNHLDWWKAAEWVGSDLFSCALIHGKVAAALLAVPVALDARHDWREEWFCIPGGLGGAPTQPQMAFHASRLRMAMHPLRTAWLRWCGVADGVSASRVLKALFEYSEAQWIKAGITQIYSIIEPGHWFDHYLRKNQYALLDEVVTMICSPQSRSVQSHPQGVQSHPQARSVQSHQMVIRRASDHDLAAVCDVDKNAFEEMWQFPLFILRRTLATSAYSTVAEIGERVVGYQMTALTEGDAHITRLAVHTDFQRCGIGGALLADTMTFMKLWYDAQHITLNTQASNQASQRLYERFGFVALSPRFRVMGKSLKA